MPMVPDWTEEQHQAARDKHAQEIKARKKIKINAEYSLDPYAEAQKIADAFDIKNPITFILCDRRGGNATS